MRRTAAILSLLYAFTSAVFWVRSHSREESVSFTIFGRGGKVFSVCGVQGISYMRNPAFWSYGPGGFSISTISSERMAPKFAKAIARAFPRWRFEFGSTFADIRVPWWFTGSTSLLAAIVIAFSNKIRRVFRPNATEPPTAPRGG